MPDLRTLTRPTFTVPWLLLALAITVLVIAQGFGRSSGMFPRFVGWVFVLLAAADVIIQLVKWYRNQLPAASGWPFALRQMKALAWLGLLLLSLFLVGFLITIPLYIGVYLMVEARQRWYKAMGIAALVFTFVYLIFIWLLSYDLYAGWLFA